MNKRYLQTIAELGLADSAWYALARALGLLGFQLQRYHFLAQRVAPQKTARAPGSIVVTAFSCVDDLPADYPRPRHVVADRFRQGGCCIAAWKGGELAGILWYQFGAYQEDVVRARYCLPSPHACWDYDVFVQPHLRLSLAFCRLWDDAQRRMQARGIEWTCSRISAFNPGSLRAHRRFDTVALGTASFLALGRWQLMLSSCAPYVHLSCGPGAYPRLVFDTRPFERGDVPCQAT